MNKVQKIFKKKKNIIIGTIHFPPLLGYPDFPGFDIALKNALADLSAFEKGGADAVIFENNYDLPHKAFVDPSTIASMAFLGEKIKKATKLPVGISVLWNDYYTALSLAKILDLRFIRVPVFVDRVKTNYGIINSEARKVLGYRKSIKAESVALFTDVHVKHAKLLSKDDIVTSAKKAIKNSSDALIITGKWTGQSPDLEELKGLRTSIGSFPILIGSGIDQDNVFSLFKYANGAIVSTSLKKGSEKKKEVNIKAYSQRIDKEKVKKLIRSISS